MKRCELVRRKPMNRSKAELPPRVHESRVIGLGTARQTVTAIMASALGDEAVVAVEKAQIVRSEAYRRWVASLPCIVCGITGYSQAAHANDNKRRGLGMKASDQYLFPLCCTRPGHMGHHFEHDNCIDMTKEQRRELEAGYVARTQAEAIAAGWCIQTLTRKV